MYKKHGESCPNPTKEYFTWKRIKQRCSPKTKKSDREKYYERGIKVCEEWQNSYPLFLGHIGRAPTAEHEIDRIDNDGNYEPGNVRWATRKENGNNKRNNHFYCLDNQKFNIRELAIYLNCNIGTIWLWYTKRGKSMEWLKNYVNTKIIPARRGNEQSTM